MPFHPPLGSQPPAGGFDQQRANQLKLIAGLCGILIGGLGVHKFVLGYTGAGLVMLIITVLGGCGFMGLGWILIGMPCGLAPIAIGVIGFIEGIVYLTKTDHDFYTTYMVGRKMWF